MAAQQAAANAAYARFPTLATGQVGCDDKPLELDQPFFSGSPIIESYKRSVFVGSIVPVNLGPLLSPQ